MNVLNKINDNPQERAITIVLTMFLIGHGLKFKFLEENKAYDFGLKSLLIPLDIAHVLKTPYPATIPSILARYIRLKKDDMLSHQFIASGEIYYVLEGQGITKNNDVKIKWSKGDVFCLPGGYITDHLSFSEDSILFCVTNEPILSFENLTPKMIKIIQLNQLIGRTKKNLKKYTRGQKLMKHLFNFLVLKLYLVEIQYQ